MTTATITHDYQQALVEAAATLNPPGANTWTGP